MAEKLHGAEATESLFFLVGRLLAKALLDRQLVTAPLNRPLLKHVLGIGVQFSDLEFVDHELHKQLNWILDCGEGEAEIGLFSVDPDLQGSGIGGALLGAAESHAVEHMEARVAVLYVLRSRTDLLGWYARCGYESTDQVLPFPTDANVGTPRPEAGTLDFVRLEKQLPMQ